MTTEETIKPTDQSVKPSDQQNELELAAFLFSVIESQITRADTKAGLVIAADSVFITALLLVSRGSLLQLLDGAAHWVVRGESLIALVVFGLLIFSTLCSLVAARPALKAPSARVRTADPGTLFFFNRISQMSHDEYVDTFTVQSSNQLRRAVLTEVHNASQIAKRKFRLVQYSIDLLIVAVGLWAILHVLLTLIV
jgi:Pycsar effector protein